MPELLYINYSADYSIVVIFYISYLASFIESGCSGYRRASPLNSVHYRSFKFLHFGKLFMALKATILKATVNVADMDRQVFLDTVLTVAQHPSETEQRMMLRLLAWICHADERLIFTKGLSADDEPEIWRHNDHNGIELWVEMGLPDEKRLRKACHQSKQVVLYAYNDRAGRVWWQQNKEKLSGHKNLAVLFLDDVQLKQLASMSARNMQLQATIQDGIIWLSDNQTNFELQFEPWQTVGE
ncbi:hypothetical protein SOASR029_29070 [Budvicia aquatica]|nr:hypothetical protein SOASR029_29070 [Budvicia aquatica]